MCSSSGVNCNPFNGGSNAPLALLDARGGGIKRVRGRNGRKEERNEGRKKAGSKRQEGRHLTGEKIKEISERGK